MRLAHAAGVAPADAVALFKAVQSRASSWRARAAKVASGPYEPPSFTVEMARKDVRLMIDEAARHDVALAVMPSVAALYDAAIARGEGGRDIERGVPLSGRGVRRAPGGRRWIAHTDAESAEAIG